MCFSPVPGPPDASGGPTTIPYFKPAPTDGSGDPGPLYGADMIKANREAAARADAARKKKQGE